MKDRSKQTDTGEPRLDRSAFAVFNSFAEADAADRAYWHSRTPQERLRTWNIYADKTMDLELPKDFKEFLRLLRAHGVEYLLNWWLGSWVPRVPALHRRS
jgi:hypothetical protein